MLSPCSPDEAKISAEQAVKPLGLADFGTDVDLMERAPFPPRAAMDAEGGKFAGEPRTSLYGVQALFRASI